MKKKDVSREEEKGANAPGGRKEVQSDELDGSSSSRGEGMGSEDAMEVGEEEQTTGSDRLSEQSIRSNPSQEAKLCQKEKRDSEGSISSFGENSFMSDHDAACVAMTGVLESKKAQEQREKKSEGEEDREGDGETGRAELNEGSEPRSAAGESGQGGDEVCENRTAQVGPSKILDRGGREPTGQMKTVTGRPSPSAEVGPASCQETCFPFVENSEIAAIQLHYLRRCLPLS